VRWTFEGQPDGATACNCTVCRRYGALWAYDYEGEGIKISGKTQPYVRGKAIEFHFCLVCGCVAFWRAQIKGQEVSELLEWAWKETPPVHKNATNLLIHLFAVPLFVVGNVLLVLGVIINFWLLVVALICIVVSGRCGTSTWRSPVRSR